MELLKALILGIIQGITEWLPISSTGHMILVDEILKLNVSEEFKEVFLVVVQFGSILAVVVIYFKNLIPFQITDKIRLDIDKIKLWIKILIACIPAGVIGVLWGDTFNKMFFNSRVVAVMLVLIGIAFLFVEKWNKNRKSHITCISDITYKAAFIIGIFQLVAAIFPGTSRSGATIIGALLLGVTRQIAAEFTFYLAVPVMAGASLLKIINFSTTFMGIELLILAVGMISAFLVSLLSIKFLMSYIKKNDFTIFGWYRIALGVVVMTCFYL